MSAKFWLLVSLAGLFILGLSSVNPAVAQTNGCCCVKAHVAAWGGCSTVCSNSPVTCGGTGSSTAEAGRCADGENGDNCASGGQSEPLTTANYGCSGPVSGGCPAGQEKCDQFSLGENDPVQKLDCTGTECVGAGYCSSPA